MRDRLLEEILQLREFRIMLLRLVPVTPEDVDVMLGELRPLLLDQDRAFAEGLVFGVGILLVDLQAGLGFDARLVRVVDTAR